MNAGQMPEIAESVMSREEEEQEDEFGLRRPSMREIEAGHHHESVK